MFLKHPVFIFILFLVSLGALIVSGSIILQNSEITGANRGTDLSHYGPPKIDIRVASFNEFTGWRSDDQHLALETFASSCDALTARSDDTAPANPQEALGDHMQGVSLSGQIGDWREPCRKAAETLSRAHADNLSRRVAARNFFEANFTPIEIRDRRTPLANGPAKNAGRLLRREGLFTGYFEPVYPASMRQTERQSAPVLRRPSDLIEVDLGSFRKNLAGQRTAGRIVDGKLVPYANHKEINDGAIKTKTGAIAYVDPNDLLFLQIQGSGKLRLQNGKVLRVGYAAQNGHPYTAVGAVMNRRKILPLEEISMQSIRRWLRQASPEDAKGLREENASYVFFRELATIEGDESGPLGAQGIPLTAERSLAVDRRYHGLITPIWLDLDPVENSDDGERFRKLMVAQDTGGCLLYTSPSPRDS